jgi:putative methionine-R-sulfoxide reductase with GAF domain
MSDEAEALRQRVQQLEDRASSLDIITALASSLTHAADIDDVLWEVANGTVARLGLEDCVIYLLDDGAGHLVQRAAYGPKNPRGREILALITIPLGKGIVGTVAATGLGERLDDVRDDPRYITDDQARLSELAVPMFFRDRVIGVIDSEHSRRAFFTEEHERLFTAIAANGARHADQHSRPGLGAGPAAVGPRRSSRRARRRGRHRHAEARARSSPGSSSAAPESRRWLVHVFVTFLVADPCRSSACFGAWSPSRSCRPSWPPPRSDPGSGSWW